MDKIKVAVIGIGKLGSIHARIYSQMKGVDLIGVCDIEENKTKKIAQDLNTKFYIDYHQI
ncbi:MAG: Gfo/Idh/MocA family oxidoreductase, partial [Candidatus Omnitrophota bacterium]